MCGIAGIIQPGRNIESEILNKMSRAMAHRGPDDLGFLGMLKDGTLQQTRDLFSLIKSEFYMIHRRLSILDLTSAGWQPMSTPDKRYSIVFNGEIYNYIELREELKTLGYQFQSQSDTEVALLAYVHWGSRALNKFAGMFALAILDTSSRKLFLARDFFGIKPLYYTVWNSGFAFGSEIKVLLTLPEVSRQVNPERLHQYLTAGLTNDGSDTFFKDIHQMPAAHYCEIALDAPRNINPICYWQIQPKYPTKISFKEAIEKLRELFLKNIRLHLRSDVPIGTALSGGIDSSSITMAMRYVLGKDSEIHTFSYIADDPALSEETWVDLIGKAGHVIQHKIQPHAEQIVQDLERLIEIQEEPFGSTSIYAQYLVFKLARQAGIKVLLDGQGADELLGGYHSYLVNRFVSLIRKREWLKASQFIVSSMKLPDFSLKSSLLTRIKRFGKAIFDGNAAWLNTDWFQERRIEARKPSKAESTKDLMEQLRLTFEKTSLPALLRYEDRNSMAFSVESRVPFLTPDLVNFIFSLPEEYIISEKAVTKSVFREAMRGLVPDPILNRTDKIGFAPPEQKWLTSAPYWKEQFWQEHKSIEIPVINIRRLKNDWNEVLHAKKAYNAKIWRWLNLILWAKYFNVVFE